MIIKIKKTDLNKLVEEVVAERAAKKKLVENKKVVKEDNPDRGGSNNKYYMVGVKVGEYHTSMTVYASSAQAAKKAAAMIARGGVKSLTGFVTRMPTNVSMLLQKFINSKEAADEEGGEEPNKTFERVPKK